MSRLALSLTINGEVRTVAVRSADRTLLAVLRDDLGLTGTNEGCGIGVRVFDLPITAEKVHRTLLAQDPEAPALPLHDRIGSDRCDGRAAS